MSTEPDPLIGQMIQNYQIVSQLGQGGVGRVYLARHPGIGKRIAVKVLRKEFAQSQTVMARFLREAQSVNEIHHENVIDIFNFVTINEQTFILMEFLDGRPLSALIKKRSVFSTQRMANIALQICSALHATHAKGIIHRDLKPDNIFLVRRAGQKDFVKLLDFGLARSVNDFALGPQTPIGMTLGTPAYMSPEQAMGDPVDAQTDIYALGVILYELATGTLPFAGQTARDLMKQQVLGKPQPPRERSPSLDAAMEEVILRCLQKEKRSRYPNMRTLALALGYTSGLDPSSYFALEGSSGKMPAVLLPEVLPAEMTFKAPASPDPDLSKTIPDEGSPFQMKTDPGEPSGHSAPSEDDDLQELELTESMVEAASIKLEIPPKEPQ